VVEADVEFLGGDEVGGVGLKVVGVELLDGAVPRLAAGEVGNPERMRLA
jgi:hypothetical protein